MTDRVVLSLFDRPVEDDHGPPAGALTLPAPEGWPAAPAPAVYHGLAGEIVDRIAPHSEADPVAILSQLLVSFGAAVGRGAWFQVEATKHHPNEFLCAARRLVVSPAQPGVIRRKLLSPMAYLDPQGERDKSMPGNRRSCPGVRGDASWDSCDMAKARLPEPQSPEDATFRPSEKTPDTGAMLCDSSHEWLSHLRSVELCPVRAIKEMNVAPRGALLYPRHSREELGGMFLDPMPNPELKDKRDSSLAENRRSCPDVWGDALGDPRDMVKAGLLDSSVSRRCNSSSAGKTSVTGAGPATASYSGRRNLQGTERCLTKAFKATNETPKSRYIRATETNVGSPTGREPHGDGVPVVVVGVATHQGGRESRPHGEGAQVTGHSRAGRYA